MESSVIVQLKGLLNRRHWLLAFDRDGTLAPITADPSKSFVSELAVKSLKALSEMSDVHVAIVSARESGRLSRDFPGSRLILAGNYGCEMVLPDGRHLIDPGAEEKREELANLKEALLKAIRPEHNIILDDHRYSLCVHCHMTPPEHIAEIEGIVKQAATGATTVEFRELPTSFEFLPSERFDKAAALDKIERALKLPDRSDIFYLFVGDSPQDEPAFQWVQDRGGAAFSVGTSHNDVARHNLKTPEDTAVLIHDLLTYRQLNFPDCRS